MVEEEVVDEEPEVKIYLYTCYVLSLSLALPCVCYYTFVNTFPYKLICVRIHLYLH